MKLEEIHFGSYELNLYANAASAYKLIEQERDEVVQELYDDIAPTMTSVDYATGQLYVSTYYTDTTALNIIDTKEKYQKMLDKLKREADLFELGMETLTDREKDVIRVYYMHHRNDLGLSQSYFLEVLESAQEKLCTFLGDMKAKKIQYFEDERKERILRSIRAS